MAAVLLSEGDPAPYVCLNTSGSGLFLIVSEHAGNAVPEGLGTLGLSEMDLVDHIAWDLHIRKVGEHLSKLLDAPYIYQPYSRLVIDCNRPPGSPQSILAVSDRRRVPGNENLSAADNEARQQEVFLPFHSRVASMLDTRAAQGMETVLITLHSFTPAMQSGSEGRPWQITFQYGRDPSFSKKMIAAMAADPNICVGDNVPYPVLKDTNYAIPAHGEKRNLLHTMIEIRQDVITDTAGQVFWANKISTVLSDVLSDLRS